MVIDFHTHAFEDRHAGRILADMGRRAGIPAYADGTVDGLVALLGRAGVDRAVVSRITPTPGQVGAVNRWLATLMGRGLVPAGAAHPDLPQVADRVAALAAEGFGGLKLHPDYLGLAVEDPRMDPIYDAARASGLWVLVHAGLDRGLPGATVHGTPEGLLEVHRRFPGLVLVAAHMGGEEIYPRTEATLVGHDVYLDTSFVLRKMPPGVFRRMVERHGADRVLFGSDAPWGDPAADLAYLDGLPFLSARQKERISGENAARILGLPEGAPNLSD